ncbi:amidohydrolase family protein [Streptomyces angustmyceticus]|nr:amidohydrolase family protein [Streptomyces angustmyceticus]UAL67958.1 amidohydrolase family protein [Streptomyces angustmyceticus]
MGLTGAGGLLGAAGLGGGEAAAAGGPHGKGAVRPEQFHGGAHLLVPEVLLLPDGPVRDRAVLVRDGTFRAIGPARQLIAAHRDLHPVRLDGHLLMPGFVDAHHHLTQSFGKARSFGRPSEIFKTVWEPLEHALDEESAYVSAKLAALEALRGGFTTVADAGTRAPVDVGVVARATEEAGLRCVLSEIVSHGADGQAHLGRWDGHPLVHPSLAIAVPEDAPGEVIKRTADLCAEAGAVLQIHVNEHLASVERSLKSVAAGDSSCGAGRMWLEHATAHSADAVGLGSVTGEIAVGKAADFLVVDLDVPELTPSYDLRWELVRLAHRDQITAVVVGGRLRLWCGRPLDWDGPALVSRAAELGPEVVRRAGLHRVEPPRPA